MGPPAPPGTQIGQAHFRGASRAAAEAAAAVPMSKLLLAAPGPHTLGQYSAYATLAFGSAFALFLYPHSRTGVLSAVGRDVIRRNAALLPAYSFVLGLLAVTGFMALAVGVDKLPKYARQFAVYKSNFAVPALILHAFPDWFAGVTFAAIGIGGLVPAAITSIAASSLYTRNIYVPFFRPDYTGVQEALNAKLASPIVKFGAPVFILAPARTPPPAATIAMNRLYNSAPAGSLQS